MTGPAWSRIEELFHAVLERGPAERKAFLDGACGGDEELRREVESRLAQESEAERLMEEPAAGAAAQKLAVTPGTRLGPYEVTGLLGAGGMVRSTARGIRGSGATWRSRSCRPTSPPTPSGSAASSARLEPLPP
jgi:hypothetical protein